ncbi:MAG: hypothetical protein QW594_04590, partial [Candidatus Woesearchaeota archaeon]
LGCKSQQGLDTIGITATKLHATLLLNIFKAQAPQKTYPELIQNPLQPVSLADSYQGNFQYFFSGGYLPGNSTDAVSAMLAKTYKAQLVINLSNVDYLYDKDPKANSNAKPILACSYQELLAITGSSWSAGKHMPFDPIGTTVLQQSAIPLLLCSAQLSNLDAVLCNQQFVGTLVR